MYYLPVPSPCQLSNSTAQTHHDHDPLHTSWKGILVLHEYSGLYLPDNLRLLAQHWPTTVAQLAEPAPRVLVVVLDGNPARGRGLTLKCSLCSRLLSPSFNVL